MLNREDIVKKLENEANKISTNIDKSENNKPVWNLEEPKLLDGEIEFKPVQPVGSWRCYYYYISNLGRVMVVKTDAANMKIKDIIKFNDSENLKFNENFWFIPIENGYLNKSVLKESPDEIKLTTTTDIYKFMIEAGWLDIKDSKDINNKYCKELSLKIVDYNIKNGVNNRIEVHHIDNNPSNNNIENLIWIPQSLHKTLH